MKPFVVASLLSLAPVALSHTVCAIIPDYHFENISNSEAVGQPTRDWARAALAHAQHLRDVRATGSGGQGITASDDDTEFDDEQDPALAAELADEDAALETADEQTPDPGSTESRKRLRRRQPLQRRQNGGLDRYVYNDNMLCNRIPPNTLVRNENSGPATDSDINSIFEEFGTVYDLYNTVYGRNSLDNAGGRLHGTAHYCYQYANAFWDGRQMVFGDGDGRVYATGGFARTQDVIGHELTHGVVQYANPLRYYGQSGALNEHLADVFGVLSEQYSLGQTADEASWLIGQGIVIGARALRDMANPGTAYDTPALGRDPQPATFADYYNGNSDNQGVHINSGIPNHAFYLFATALGGNAFDVPGRIWYNVLSQGQGQFDYAGETFNRFAQRTINAATALYDADTADALGDAWRQVGVI